MRLTDLLHHLKSMQDKELFMIFSRLDVLIEQVLKVFERKTYCKSFRLLNSMLYHLFMDLIRIYQDYYVLMTVTLEKFDKMHV